MYFFVGCKKTVFVAREVHGAYVLCGIVHRNNRLIAYNS